MANFFEKWTDASENRRRLLAQEKYILDVSEKIWESLERQNISKADLATRLGKSKSHVTQLLNGSRNMTLRTLADIAYALGADVHTHFLLKDDKREWIQFGKIATSHSKQANEIYSIGPDTAGEWTPPEPVRARCVNE